jgi:hypothetical protein
MPTSNGLSYSMNSLPRIACTIGAFSLPARAISSACAPAHPAPPRIVAFDDAFRIFASTAISSSEGHTEGFGSGKVQARLLLDGLAQCHVAGQDDDRHPAPRQRRLHGDLERARHLFGWETSSQ